jgi:hypothetical protein
MNLWQRLKTWWEHDEFAFDAEYDRIHSEINENPMILIDAIKPESVGG